MAIPRRQGIVILMTSETATQPRALRDYQIEASDAVINTWASGINRTAVVLPTGSGKPQPDSTLIPTPSGMRRLGDLRVGDAVFTASGKWTHITAVLPQGVIDVHRVTFSDGTSALTGPGHLWEVKRKGRKSRIVTTAWLAQQDTMIDRDGWLWRIPMTAPVEYATTVLPIDPYLLGTLIANGYLFPKWKTAVFLTTPDDAVIARVRSLVDDVRDYTTVGYCPRFALIGVRAAINDMGLDVPSGRKSIPEQYLTASVSQRIDLLQGLMDADGSSRGGGRRSVNYHTTSPQLAKDVQRLIWSLGGTASINVASRDNTEFTLSILLPSNISAWWSPRKKRAEHPRNTFEPRRSIVSVEPAGYESSRCISVDDPSGLYVTGHEHIVTHNSTVGADIAVRAHRDFGLDVAFIAHRAELLDQLADSVHQVAPNLNRVGIVRADNDESDAPIIAASIQTLMNSKRLERIGKRRVVVFDEVHHSSADTWKRVLTDLGIFQPDHFFCGLTATLRRDDGKALRDVIQTVAYEQTLRWAIERGSLVKPNGLTVRIPNLDLNKVKVTAGDFQNNDLAEVMEAASPYVVQAIMAHARDRRPFIFAASVDAAHGMAAMLRDAGMAASAITGDMPYAARQEVYDAFRDGRTQALVTVQVLTEGADFPMCDCVVLARPTQSQNLYSQMVGRALRTYPGKTDALVLDLAGSSRVLSLITLSNLDCGATPKKIELDGTEIPPEDDEEVLPAAPSPRMRRSGAVDLVTIDLLASESTHVNWLQTQAGFPFIQPAAAGYIVFLWPDGNGLWKIGRMVTKPSELVYHLDNGWEDEGKAWPVDIAAGIAEDVVISHGDPMPLRDAAWRKTSKPSDAQVRFAQSLGIADADMFTRAALSDQISVSLISKWLDPK